MESFITPLVSKCVCDGNNDLFFPYVELTNAGVADYFESYDLQIFDRWGLKVFETTQLDKGWNGMTPKNKTADTGTYYWIAKIKSNCSKEETIEKGFVQLVR